MTDTIKFYQGTREQIDVTTVANGSFYVSTDDEKLFVDLNNKRICFIEDMTESEIDSLMASVEK